MARYLVATSPIPGHVAPLLEIAGDLTRRGHEVTVLTGAEHRADVQARGAAMAVLPDAGRPRRTRTYDLGPVLLQRWRTGLADMTAVFVDPLEVQAAALARVLASQSVDAVLCDVAFTGVLPMLLTPWPRPPVIACGVTPLMLSSADTPPFGMGWQPTTGFDYRRMTWVVHNVLFARLRTRLNAALRRAGAPALPVFLTDWFTLADRVVQFTIPELEFPRSDLPPMVTFAGAIPLAGTEVAVPQRGSRRPVPVVHVTQGTWDNADLDDLLVPTLTALADRDDLEVVATTGRIGEPPRLDAVPRNAHVMDFVPYDELLPHVDVMVSNGGYGGVHHALRHGIPLVIAGRTSDKPEVAARIAYAGAGVDLGPTRPTPAAIEAAVDRVRTDPSYRRAAEEIASKLLQRNAFDAMSAVLDELAVADAVSER